MRIPSADIKYQANILPASNTSPTADKLTTRQQEIAARDSYNKNAGSSAQSIIDAEYVEFYSPSTSTFKKERQTLDNTIEAEETNLQSTKDITSGNNIPSGGRYQLGPHEAPPPGSYIDLFA